MTQEEMVAFICSKLKEQKYSVVAGELPNVRVITIRTKDEEYDYESTYCGLILRGNIWVEADALCEYDYLVEDAELVTQGGLESNAALWLEPLNRFARRLGIGHFNVVTGEWIEPPTPESMLADLVTRITRAGYTIRGCTNIEERFSFDEDGFFCHKATRALFIGRDTDATSGELVMGLGFIYNVEEDDIGHQYEYWRPVSGMLAYSLVDEAKLEDEVSPATGFGVEFLSPLNDAARFLGVGSYVLDTYECGGKYYGDNLQ